MKIKSIAAICKKNKNIAIFERYSDDGDIFTLTRNGFQQVTGYNIEGITENQPVYLDFEQVAAVVRVFSDEKEVADE